MGNLFAKSAEMGDRLSYGDERRAADRYGADLRRRYATGCCFVGNKVFNLDISLFVYPISYKGHLYTARWADVLQRAVYR